SRARCSELSSRRVEMVKAPCRSVMAPPLCCVRTLERLKVRKLQPSNMPTFQLSNALGHHSRLAQRPDRRLGIAQLTQHFVGVLAQQRRRQPHGRRRLRETIRWANHLDRPGGRMVERLDQSQRCYLWVGKDAVQIAYRATRHAGLIHQRLDLVD